MLKMLDLLQTILQMFII